MSFYTSSVSPSVWDKENLEIAALSIVYSRDIDLIDTRTVKYIFSFFGNNTVKSFELNLNNENGSLIESISNIVGNMNLDITPEIDSGNLRIKITNNENFTIKSNIAYVTLNNF